ncbi:MAG: O-methyltransferase [Natronosporangium sp.]
MRNLLTVTDELYEYLLAHTTPLDPVARELVEQTRAVLPDRAQMQIGPDQAMLLTILTRLAGARQAVEVGTFTGFSALAIARGLPSDGQLVCFDISTEYTDIARRYWDRAGVADRIDLRIGPAADRIRELPEQPHLDLAFIDADKAGYPDYWAQLVPRVRPGGLLAVDNVLWSGRVADPAPGDESARMMARFNEMVAGDDRVDVVILPVGDGLTLARRR